MKKPLALAGAVAGLAALGGTVGVASAASNPSWGNGTIWSDLSGSPAYYVDATLVPGTLSGDVTVEVDQNGVTAGPVVMADIDLGVGFTVDSVVSVSVVSDEDGGGSCSGTPVISVRGDDITAKGFACSDTDTDGYVEFSLVADDIQASTTNTVDGSYELESQYRTNSTRRVKAQSWVVENVSGITLSAE